MCGLQPYSVVSLKLLSSDKGICMTHCYQLWTYLRIRVAAACCQHLSCSSRRHCTISKPVFMIALLPYTSNWRWTSTGAAPFKHKNQITLLTSTFDHVSNKPAIFKLILWCKARFWCHLAAVQRQWWFTSVRYMVKSELVWCHFTWDMLLAHFLKRPCKFMPRSLTLKRAAIAQTVYMHLSSGSHNTQVLYLCTARTSNVFCEAQDELLNIHLINSILQRV